VGDLWDELGNLQLAFLRKHGLRPGHRLLDIGCGSLRGGVKLIPYLEPGNYWGMDHNAALLDAGWELELGPLGLQDRLPRHQLAALSDFEFDQLGATFDVAIAQSVFTHFSLNRIRRCLAKLAAVMEPGGHFFATFFEAPSDHHPEDALHYALEDLRFVVQHLPWQMVYIGEWQHPRDQRMVLFIRTESWNHPIEVKKVRRPFSLRQLLGVRNWFA
jgi:cyclopropane fatty-acyl-phospholipid synthase-like methyltransferase